MRTTNTFRRRGEIGFVNMYGEKRALQGQGVGHLGKAGVRLEGILTDGQYEKTAAAKLGEDFIPPELPSGEAAI